MTDGGKLSYTLNETLYLDEQVVIYDIGDGNRKQKRNAGAEEKNLKLKQKQKEN